MQFQIDGNADFIHLPDTELVLKIKVTTDTGANLANAAVVGTINYLGNTLFQHLDIYVNNDLVLTHQNYEYNSYIQTLMSHDDSTKNSYLQLRHSRIRKSFLKTSNTVRAKIKRTLQLFQKRVTPFRI